ncbi:C-type lectin domain family 4 member G [Fundulus heteroclitus]|uniref:C-type lectin domain family 4 member G n=1 Tax=Fundulus heteroclitus TaxID=8078 RepID=UPI00165A9F11|nr:C-type lectin domain family 4 member G [Fundulus heteroclitus]
MAENEVMYASVVVKSRRPKRAKKEEEVVYGNVKLPNQTVQQTLDTNAKKEEEVVYGNLNLPNQPVQQTLDTNEEDVVYGEVKLPNQTVQQTLDTNDSAGLLSNKEAERKHRWYQKLACCLGILCVILALALIGVCVLYLFSYKRDKQELKQLKANQTLLLEEIYNLTDLNKKVSSDFNIQVQNLTQEKENLRLQNQNLKTELDEVKNKTQKLQKEIKNLKGQIETMDIHRNEQNASQAQWSINEYCPKENNKRNCSSCQKGWLLSQSSCYAVNNAEPPNQKTWEEAREDCRGKISHLTVVGDEEEKKFVKDKSWANNIKGYWIGLRAEGGKWKWIDGSDLTNQAWIQQQKQPAVDGQCVTSLQDREWSSVSCDEKNAWICEKKALSV